ncbi:MAG: helix-turn-helix domain-containing protein [Nocardioidaceae bacterium]|nr:helix-turn-helix domain-containing protein [Nocardioidaceae bacterium]
MDLLPHRAALGRTLRDLRTARGTTLRQVAGELGVSAATLSAIENGKTGVSSERVSRLAEVLGVPVQRLFDLDDATVRATGAWVARPGPPRAWRAADGDWRRFDPLVLDPALAGALSSFLEFGYHGATMRTIAERSRLSVPGLYHHYASKQEMLVAILDLTMSDLLARTRVARDEGEGPVERFALVVECLALFHTHRRELGFVGASEMRSLDHDDRERIAAARREQQHLVDTEVEEGVRAGLFATDRPHEAARAVVTMITATAQWFRASGPATAEEVAAQYVEFALDLVRHRPS